MPSRKQVGLAREPSLLSQPHLFLRSKEERSGDYQCKKEYKKPSPQSVCQYGYQKHKRTLRIILIQRVYLSLEPATSCYRR